MKTLTALTYLVEELNQRLDSGEYDSITPEDVFRRISNGEILQYIHHRLDVDISLMDAEFELPYARCLQSSLDALGRPVGVHNKGLCVLIAWTNAIIQRGSGWVPDDNVSDNSLPGEAALHHHVD